MLCFFPTLLWRSLRSYRLKLHKDMLQLFVQFSGRVLALTTQGLGKTREDAGHLDLFKPPQKNRNIPYSFPELLDFERKPKPCFPSTLFSWELLLIQPCQFALSHDLKSMTIEISNGCCPHQIPIIGWVWGKSPLVFLSLLVLSRFAKLLNHLPSGNQTRQRLHHLYDFPGYKPPFSSEIFHSRPITSPFVIGKTC